MADRRSVILKWVFGSAGAFSSGGIVELVVVVVVDRARETLNRDVGLIQRLLHDINEDIQVCNLRKAAL